MTGTNLEQMTRAAVYPSERKTQKGGTVNGGERWYCHKIINFLRTLSSFFNFFAPLQPPLLFSLIILHHGYSTSSAKEIAHGRMIETINFLKFIFMNIFSFVRAKKIQLAQNNIVFNMF